MPDKPTNSTAGSPNDDPVPFEQRFPAAYRRLVKVRRIVERHFHDVCDVEFTVQDGQLFINGVRPARRAPVANLRFALQFLAEGKINPHEFLRRVTPSDVVALVAPAIQNKDALHLLGRGIPACAGVVSGKVAFCASDVLDLSARGIPAILVKTEVSPDDLRGIIVSQGVLTTRGGVSSHAALIGRQMNKPCVVGYSPTRSKVEHEGRVHAPFQEGIWVTIDGTSGEVFEGEGICESVNWRERPELVALSEIVGWAIATGNVACDSTGQVWKISDFFLHSVSLARSSTVKRAVSRLSFNSFTQPDDDTLVQVQRCLTALVPRERDNYSEILLSLMDVLFRLLSSGLGIGNHPRYFRPLWDPKRCVKRTIPHEGTQLVGMEFFGINQYIPHLVDVATITLLLEIEVFGEGSEWFLDFTNPLGESLVPGSRSVRAYRLLLNDAQVMHDDLPVLYNSLRRREYRWQFYENNLTSHSQIADVLAAWNSKKSIRSSLLSLCFEQGLIRNNKLTMVGKSLLGKLRRNKKYEFTAAKGAS